MKYKIIRFFFSEDQDNVVLRRHVTLEEAQKHCQDPETSSTTCKGAIANERTRVHGPWFDGYKSEQ